MDSCHDGIAFHAEVTDGGSVREAEEAAVVVIDRIAVGYGVPLPVKDTSELCFLNANHGVGIIAFPEVDVCHQLGIDVGGTAIHHACKDVEVPVVADIEEIFLSTN